MALTTTARFVRHVITDGAASKPFDFQVDRPQDVRVRFITLAAPDPAWLVFGVDFTVQLNVTSTGGTVTFTPALVGAGTVEIERLTARTQQRRFRDIARFPSEAAEAAFDQAMMSIQDMREELDRALTIPRGVAIDPAATVIAAGGMPRVRADGTAIEWVLLAEIGLAVVREVLTGPRTYFVRANGSDSNDGLADTAGGAFLTLQRAIDVCLNEIDNAGFNVTINAEGVTYTGGAIVNGPWVGDGDVTLVMGAGGLISTTDAHGVLVLNCGRLKLNFTGGAKIQTATTGLNVFNGVYALLGGVIEATAVSFGAVAGSKWQASGGQIVISGNTESTGNAVSEFHATGGSSITCQAGTYTLSGTPAYSAYFIGTSHGGAVTIASLTFSGAATGKRFTCHKNSIIDAGSKARADIPGDVPGQTATGGRFVGAGSDVEAFRAHKNGTDQTGIANAVLTQITFGAEAYDTNAIFASNGATPTGGLWRFAMQLKATGCSAATTFTAAIFKSGALLASQDVIASAGGVATVGMTVTDLAGGADVYTVHVLGLTAGTISIEGDAHYTFFEGLGH